MTKEEKKVLLFEDTQIIEKSKDQTEKVIRLINNCQKIYTKWKFENLSIRQYEEIAAGNYDPMGYVMNQAAKGATALKKMKIKHESIMDLIGLPENYQEFEQKIDELKKFVQAKKRSSNDWFIVFNAITYENNVAKLDEEKFEEYCEIYRIYATNQKQIEIARLGEAAAKHLTKFQNALRQTNRLGYSGLNSVLMHDPIYFKITDEKDFQFRYGQIPSFTD